MAKYTNTVEYNLKTSYDGSGFKKLGAQLTQAQTQLANMSNTLSMDQVVKDATESVKKLKIEINKSMNAQSGIYNLSKLSKQITNIEAQYGSLYKNMSLIGATGKANFAAFTAEASKFGTSIRTTSNLVDKFANTLGNTVRWGITASIFETIRNRLQDSVGYVKDLDYSLNQIRIVTEDTAEEMRKFTFQAQKMAQALGSTTVGFTNASLIFAQQGYSLEQSAKLAELTLKTANVTGQATAEVSEQLTSLLNGFQISGADIQAATAAVDKLAKVAAVGAADLEELAVAESKVASTAHTLGVEQDQLVSQLSTIISVTRQAPENVGNAMKTIYARFADLKLGKTLEDEVSLGDVSKTLAKVGVNVLDTTGSLRNMGDVIEDLMNVWDGLTTAERQAVAVKLAGKYQYNNLLALLENSQMYYSQLEASMESIGTIDKQQEIFMDSLESKFNALATSVEGFINELFNANEYKPFLDFVIGVISKVTKFVDSIDLSGNMLTMLGSIGAETFNKQISAGITNTIGRISDMNVALNNSVEAMNMLKNAGIEIGNDDPILKEFVDNLTDVRSNMALTTEQQQAYDAKVSMFVDSYTQYGNALDDLNQKIMNINSSMRALTKEQDVYAQYIDGELTLDVDYISMTERDVKSLNHLVRNMQESGFLEKITGADGKQGILSESAKELLSGASDLFGSKELNIENIEKKIESLKFQGLRDELMMYVDAVKKAEEGTTEYDKAMNELRTQIRNAAEAMSNGILVTSKELQDEAQEVGMLSSNVAQAAEAMRQFKIAANFQELISNTISFASAIGLVYSSLNSLTSLQDILSDETMTNAEKLTGVVQNVAYNLPTIITSLNNAVGTIKEFKANGGISGIISDIKAFLGINAGLTSSVGGIFKGIKNIKNVLVNTFPYLLLTGGVAAVMQYVKSLEKAEEQAKKTRDAILKTAAAADEEFEATYDIEMQLKKLQADYTSGEKTAAEYEAGLRSLGEEMDINTTGALSAAGQYAELTEAIKENIKEKYREQAEAKKARLVSDLENSESGLKNIIELMDVTNGKLLSEVVKTQEEANNLTIAVAGEEHWSQYILAALQDIGFFEIVDAFRTWVVDTFGPAIEDLKAAYKQLWAGILSVFTPSIAYASEADGDTLQEQWNKSESAYNSIMNIGDEAEVKETLGYKVGVFLQFVSDSLIKRVEEIGNAVSDFFLGEDGKLDNEDIARLVNAVGGVIELVLKEAVKAIGVLTGKSDEEISEAFDGIDTKVGEKISAIIEFFKGIKNAYEDLKNLVLVTDGDENVDWIASAANAIKLLFELLRDKVLDGIYAIEDFVLGDKIYSNKNGKKEITHNRTVESMRKLENYGYFDTGERTGGLIQFDENGFTIDFTGVVDFFSERIKQLKDDVANALEQNGFAIPEWIKNYKFEDITGVFVRTWLDIKGWLVGYTEEELKKYTESYGGNAPEGLDGIIKEKASVSGFLNDAIKDGIWPAVTQNIFEPLGNRIGEIIADFAPSFVANLGWSPEENGSFIQAVQAAIATWMESLRDKTIAFITDTVLPAIGTAFGWEDIPNKDTEGDYQEAWAEYLFGKKEAGDTVGLLAKRTPNENTKLGALYAALDKIDDTVSPIISAIIQAMLEIANVFTGVEVDGWTDELSDGTFTQKIKNVKEFFEGFVKAVQGIVDFGWDENKFSFAFNGFDSISEWLNSYDYVLKDENGWNFAKRMSKAEYDEKYNAFLGNGDDSEIKGYEEFNPLLDIWNTIITTLSNAFTELQNFFSDPDSNPIYAGLPIPEDFKNVVTKALNGIGRVVDSIVTFFTVTIPENFDGIAEGFEKLNFFDAIKYMNDLLFNEGKRYSIRNNKYSDSELEKMIDLPSEGWFLAGTENDINIIDGIKIIIDFFAHIGDSIGSIIDEMGSYFETSNLSEEAQNKINNLIDVVSGFFLDLLDDIRHGLMVSLAENGGDAGKMIAHVLAGDSSFLAPNETRIDYLPGGEFDKVFRELTGKSTSDLTDDQLLVLNKILEKGFTLGDNQEAAEYFLFDYLGDRENVKSFLSLLDSGDAVEFGKGVANNLASKSAILSGKFFALNGLDDWFTSDFPLPYGRPRQNYSVAVTEPTGELKDSATDLSTAADNASVALNGLVDSVAGTSLFDTLRGKSYTHPTSYSVTEFSEAELGNMQSTLESLATTMGFNEEQTEAAIKSVISTIDVLLSSEDASVFNSGKDIAYNLINGIDVGITQGKDDLYSHSDAIINAILKAMQDAAGIASPSKKTKKIGEYIDEGLVIGMQDGERDVYDTSGEVGMSAIEGMKDALDEHSPSKKAIEIAKYFILGLVQGLDENRYLFYDAIGNVADEGLARFAEDIKNGKYNKISGALFGLDRVADYAITSSGINALENLAVVVKGKSDEDGSMSFEELFAEASKTDSIIDDYMVTMGFGETLEQASNELKDRLEKQREIVDDAAQKFLEDDSDESHDAWVEAVQKYETTESTIELFEQLQKSVAEGLGSSIEQLTRETADWINAEIKAGNVDISSIYDRNGVLDETAFENALIKLAGANANLVGAIEMLFDEESRLTEVLYENELISTGKYYRKKTQERLSGQSENTRKLANQLIGIIDNGTDSDAIQTDRIIAKALEEGGAGVAGAASFAERAKSMGATDILGYMAYVGGQTSSWSGAGSMSDLSMQRYLSGYLRMKAESMYAAGPTTMGELVADLGKDSIDMEKLIGMLPKEAQALYALAAGQSTSLGDLSELMQIQTFDTQMRFLKTDEAQEAMERQSRLESIQEQEAARRALIESTAAEAERLSKIGDNVPLNALEDVKGALQEIDDMTKSIAQQKYAIQIDMVGDAIDKAETLIEAIDDAAAAAEKVTDDFIISKDEADTVLSTMPELYDMIVAYTEEGAVLSEEETRAYLENKEAEARAAIDARKAELEADINIMQTNMATAQGMIDAVDTFISGTSNMSLAELQQMSNNADAEIMGSIATMAETDKQALENMQGNQDTYYSNTSDMSYAAAEDMAYNFGLGIEAMGIDLQVLNERLATVHTNIQNLGDPSAEMLAVSSILTAGLQGGKGGSTATAAASHQALSPFTPSTGSDEFFREYGYGSRARKAMFEEAEMQKEAEAAAASELREMWQSRYDLYSSMKDSLQKALVKLNIQASTLDYNGYNKDDGSGGSGGGAEKQLELIEDERDLYEEVNAQLNIAEKHLSKLQEHQERLSGDALTENLKEQVKLLQREIALYGDMVAIQENEAANYALQLSSRFGTTFNDDATIGNYFGVYDQLYGAVQAAYNSGDEDAMKDAEDNLKDYEELVQKYDKLITEDISGTYNTMVELQHKIQDMAIEAMNESLDAIGEMRDVKDQFIETQRVINGFRLDDAFGDLYESQNKMKAFLNISGDIFSKELAKSAEIIASATASEQEKAIAEAWNSALQYGKNLMENDGKLSVVEAYQAILNEVMDENSALMESIFDENPAMNNSLYQEFLQNVVTSFEKAIVEMEQLLEDYESSIVDVMSQANEKIEERNDLYDDANESLSYAVELAKILYGEASYGQINDILSRQQELLEQNLSDLQQQQQYWENIMNMSERNSKTWQEAYSNLKGITDKIQENTKAIAENARQILQNSFSDASNSWVNQLFGDTDIDWLQKQWEMVTETAEQYLDDVNRAYEIQKIENAYDDMLKDSSGIAVQQQITEQRDEQLRYLREQTRLSQYQVDYANAQLEILRKVIALQDAQRNKSQMKLRRDTQGNYSYTYVANEEDINKAQQDLLDAQNSAYNLSKDYIVASENDIYSTVGNALSAIQDLANNKNLTKEEMMERYEAILANAKERITYYADEIGIAEGNILNDFVAMAELIMQDNAGNMSTVYDEIKNGVDDAMNQIDERLFSSLSKTADAIREGTDVMSDYALALSEAIVDYGAKIDEIAASGVDGYSAIADAIGDATDATANLSAETQGFFDILNNESDLIHVALDDVARLRKEVGATAANNDVLRAQLEEANDTLQAVREGKMVSYEGEIMTTQAAARAEEEKRRREEESRKAAEAMKGAQGGATGNGNVELGDLVTLTGLLSESSDQPANLVPYPGYENGQYYVTMFNPGSASPYHLSENPDGSGWVGWVDLNQIRGFDTGGYTGKWNDGSGKLAMLHSKEIVLNANDTKNILSAVELVREMSDAIQQSAIGSFGNVLGMMMNANRNVGTTDKVQQDIHIEANFPNANSADDIREALMSLPQRLLQYTSRR